LIILDEPFSGLDPVNSNLIKDEIYALARQGASIIFSTHRMEQVEEICDHIILVNKGQKILDGTVSGVKQQYKENLFSIGLEATGKQGEAGTAGGERPEGAAFEAVGQKDGRWIIKIRDGYRPNDVLRQFIDQGTGITSFTEILPSLNDIFIRLVEGTPLARQFQPISI
jgi:ABC-2 type transport system ATP-binding protein